MGWSHRIAIVAGLAMMVMGAGSGGAAVIVVPPRPGQVGLSVQGQYGSLMKSGDIGENFGSGPGLAVRLRYRMRYERGFGLSFESHEFDARVNGLAIGNFAEVAEDSVPSKVTLGMYGVDFYQMFGTRTRTTKMLSVGAGITRVTQEFTQGDSNFPGDGMFVTAGAGVERFFWQSWGWDVSGRYYGIFRDRQVSHEFQISAGLVFYASL
jgi:hypothetical protein